MTRSTHTCPLHGLFTTVCPHCEHETARILRGAVNGPVRTDPDRVGRPILNLPAALRFAEVEEKENAR